MAKVTKELIADIETVCKSEGWKNDLEAQIVSLSIQTKYMSTTYEAIAELVALHGLGVEEVLRNSFIESGAVPEVKLETVEALSVVASEDVRSLVKDTLFFSSEEDAAVVSKVKDQDIIWVCKKCADGTVCRVPCVVRI